MGQVYNEPQETLGGWFYFLLIINILNTLGQISFIRLFINSAFPIVAYIQIIIHIIIWGIFGFLKYKNIINYKVMLTAAFVSLIICMFILGLIYEKEINMVYLTKVSSWMDQINKIKVKK